MPAQVDSRNDSNTNNRRAYLAHRTTAGDWSIARRPGGRLVLIKRRPADDHVGPWGLSLIRVLQNRIGRPAQGHLTVGVLRIFVCGARLSLTAVSVSVGPARRQECRI
jgi:hypothetical protein